MPAYLYRCRKGHLTEEFRPIVQRDDPTVCGKCKGKAKRDNKAEFRFIGIRPEFFEHFDAGIGEVVTSRKDRARKQQAKGFSDYDPSDLPIPTDWK